VQDNEKQYHQRPHNEVALESVLLVPSTSSDGITRVGGSGEENGIKNNEVVTLSSGGNDPVILVVLLDVEEDDVSDLKELSELSLVCGESLESESKFTNGGPSEEVLIVAVVLREPFVEGKGSAGAAAARLVISGENHSN
jgi:hypothetical protein